MAEDGFKPGVDQTILHERLKSGAVIAMFDGLNEVFDPARRKTVLTAIQRFSNDYPLTPDIVTSREIGC